MGTSKFEIADYLDSKEMIVEYLNTVLKKEIIRMLLMLLGISQKQSE